jgi:hypothetical protein
MHELPTDQQFGQEIRLQTEDKFGQIKQCFF